MSIEFHAKMNKILDLYTRPKQLTDEAAEHLRDKTFAYMESQGKSSLDLETFQFIINYVYNEAYKAAIADALTIIRE